VSFDYRTYLSPFTWRYASPAMRQIWSEQHRRQIWRRVWVALAEAESDFGLVSQAQLDDLHSQVDNVDVGRALEIEGEIHHDLMAELKSFAEQALEGGAILHLGATSADIEDNADVLRIREALDLVLEWLRELLLEFAERIERWSDTPLIAFTHLQPAEPSTLGYRMAIYGQDLYLDWASLYDLRQSLKGKGMRGAVGTSASFVDLIGTENLDAFETRISELLGLTFFSVTSQVYPRKQDYQLISALSGLGGSLYKFAFDLRFLQSPGVGEWSEPFGAHQVGSSAMPFKRNPIQAEKIDSLGRQLAQLPRLAWDNAAHSLLERTLDDSANRRTLLPEAFLLADEMLITMRRVFSGLVIDQLALERNLADYGPFAAIERVLMAVGKAGADRQEMHERLRQHAMLAWGVVRSGNPNPLSELIPSDPELQAFIPEAELRALLDASDYLGEAPRRAREFAARLREALEQGNAQLH
jgi:adenylosuccinate lyase